MTEPMSDNQALQPGLYVSADDVSVNPPSGVTVYALDPGDAGFTVNGEDVDWELPSDLLLLAPQSRA